MKLLLLPLPTAVAALVTAGTTVLLLPGIDHAALSRAPLWVRPFLLDTVIAAAALAAVLIVRLIRPSRRLAILAAFALTAGLAEGSRLLIVQLIGSAPMTAPIVVGLLLIGAAATVLPTALEAALATRYAVGGLFAVGMFVDYGLGYPPPLPAGVTLDHAALIAAVTTVGLLIGLLTAPVRLPLNRPPR